MARRAARATSLAFIPPSSAEIVLLCAVLIVPKHRLEKRRLKLEYTFGPATTVSRSASATAPDRFSRTSRRFASE
jgi:hypothetical protein